MATSRPMKVRVDYQIKRSGSLQPLEDVTLGGHTSTCLKIYGEEVNLDRSVPDFRDGLKPVSRRLLWALHTMRADKIVKTARLSGETIGKYHPHGDSSANGAILTQVIACTPPIEGIGNWGSLIDPPGAPRYTNVKMHRFGESFFGREYLPLTTMVDNYDGKEKEPMFLPALLPNLLLNGIEGIGLGLATSIPAFTPKSLLPVVAEIVEGKDLSSVEIAKRLHPYHQYGGEFARTKENLAALKKLVEEPQSSFVWTTPLEIDRDAKQITLTNFAPEIKPVKLIDEWVKQQKEVSSVYTGSGVSYTIKCRRDINYVEFDSFVARLKTKTTVKSSYEIYVTRRDLKEGKTNEYDVVFARMPLLQVLKSWSKYRIGLEKKSIEYRIGVTKAAIEHLDLLLFACANLETVFKSLRSKDPKDFLVKNLKLTPEQAETILNLKVRQLSALDNAKIKEERQNELDKLKKLQSSLKITPKIVADFLRDSANRFELVQNDWSTQWVLR